MFDCQRVSMMTYHCLYWRCPFEKCTRKLSTCHVHFFSGLKKHITCTRKTCCWRKHRVFFRKESELRVFKSAPEIPWIMWTFLSFILLFPLSGNPQKNIKKWKKYETRIPGWYFADVFHIFSTSFPAFPAVFSASLGETTSNLSRKRTSMMTGQLTAWAKVKIDSSFFPRKRDTLCFMRFFVVLFNGSSWGFMGKSSSFPGESLVFGAMIPQQKTSWKHHLKIWR